MLKWVVKLDPTFPKMIKITPELQDLIKKCLIKDPNHRLGSKNIQEIFDHEWFKDINWEDVRNLKIEPPVKPQIQDKFDIENFNKEVVNEKPRISDLKPMDQDIVDTHKNDFEGF